jgi:hypothetical protein
LNWNLREQSGTIPPSEWSDNSKHFAPVFRISGRFFCVRQELWQGMKRTRHKRTPSVRRRALEIIAAHPDGCTEAILVAENIPADLLIELVRGGLVTARSELLEDEDGAVVATTLWITAAGERVLAARG